MQQFLDTKEAAKYVRLSTATLERLRVTGGGPSFIKPIPTRVVYDVVEPGRLDARAAPRVDLRKPGGLTGFSPFAHGERFEFEFSRARGFAPHARSLQGSQQWRSPRNVKKPRSAVCSAERGRNRSSKLSKQQDTTFLRNRQTPLVKIPEAMLSLPDGNVGATERDQWRRINPTECTGCITSPGTRQESRTASFDANPGRLSVL